MTAEQTIQKNENVSINPKNNGKISKDFKTTALVIMGYTE